MPAEKVVEIISDLREIGIEVILDGGWGIDALLKKQTRPHKDLDFLINKPDVEKLKEYFANRGYAVTDDSQWWHFMLDDGFSVVDVHVIDIDEAGNGVYGPKEMNALFPADGLNGSGEILGLPVNSLTPEYRVKCLTKKFGVVVRTGYSLTEKDYIDVKALCDRFNIQLPEDFIQFAQAR